ncbi:hypothetical protein BJV78DRAFT_1233113 [Lactifluus subvellereus]|nr:hypothetical protein BJV78DRAFT_1233113 [Lactifluus subvellereus]
MSPPVIAVFGATGTQGSAVVDALLSDGTFTPRAITRNPASDKALALKARGAEVAQADIWDKESIIKAITGCEGVFGVTDFFDPKIYPNNLKGEIEQGKNLVDASKEVGIKFFVWSSLPGCAKISKGKYRNIAHFDNKAAIEEYLTSSGIPNATVQTGWFTENLWKFGALVTTPSGTFELPIPKYSASSDQSFTWVARDLGPCVLALFKHRDREEINNRAFPVITAKMTYPEFAKILEKSLGKNVKFVSPSTSGIEEFDEMYEYQSTIGFYETPVPNPDLVALGVTFGTLEEFAETEVKSRFT